MTCVLVVSTADSAAALCTSPHRGVPRGSGATGSGSCAATPAVPGGTTTRSPPRPRIASEQSLLGSTRGAKFLGTTPACEIDRGALLRVQDALKSEIGAETVNTYLRRAAAYWRWCEERGLIDKAWPRIKPLRKPAARKRPYTPAEVEAVLAWLRDYEEGRWYPLLSLVAETGRRVSEVCKLRGRDVDRVGLTITVRQKGDRTLVLPVTPETLALLPGLFRRPRDRRTGGGWGPARRDTVLGVVRRAISEFGSPTASASTCTAFAGRSQPTRTALASRTT